jgi:sugar phosphate permease
MGPAGLTWRKGSSAGFSGVGASLSTLITGIVTQRFGYVAGLVAVTAVGLTALVVTLEFMQETKPPRAAKLAAMHSARVG